MFQAHYGYFDLVVDTSEVNLAVRYTVTCSIPENSDIPDAKIVGYSFPGQQNYITYIDNTQNSVSSSSAASVNTNTIFEEIGLTYDTNLYFICQAIGG